MACRKWASQKHKMKEQPAKGVKGFFLYNPFTKRHWFRVYDETDRSKYKDYRVAAEEIEVEIICDSTSLYEAEDGEGNKLDWNSRVLGRK
jgi:hypothetical protein